MRAEALFDFMHERWLIYQRKERGEPKPWTKDPILQQYRFTTPYRELDKVTVWIRENWREPHHDDPDLWFALCVARYINWPETLEYIGYPVPWNGPKVCRMLNKKTTFTEKYMMAKSHKEAPHKIERVQRKYSPQIFGGAYFLNSIGPKIESIVNDRLTPLWENRKQITSDLKAAGTLKEMFEVFHSQFGFGSFMAGQIVADLKFVDPWTYCGDWWTWAVPGPGSKRGMLRLFNQDGGLNGSKFSDQEWCIRLEALWRKMMMLAEDAGMPPLSAQDLQGWLCEFDKYERARLGEGRPKTKYPGGADGTD